MAPIMDHDALSPLSRHLLNQTGRLLVAQEDPYRGRRNVAKIVWTAIGGIGRLPFVGVSSDWAGGRPVVTVLSATSNQGCFLGIDFVFMSEILNQQIRHYSGPELEMRRSSNRRELVKGLARIGLSIVGAEAFLFPYAFAAREANADLTIASVNMATPSFCLMLIGPLAYTTYSVYLSVGTFGGLIRCRRDPVELELLRIRAEMVGRLGQTRVALLELGHHDLAARIQAIEEVSATGNIDQVLKLLEGEPGEGGALEVAPDEAPRPLVGYVVPTCRVLGSLGMLGMLAIQTKLAQTGGEVLAEQIGFSPGAAEGISWSVAVLSDVFSLRLFWDGIVGSAANIGEGIINYFSHRPSVHYRLSPRLTIALNLASTILASLVWTPMDEIADQEYEGAAATIVQASASLGITLLAIGSLQFVVQAIVETKVNHYGEEEERNLLLLSEKLLAIQRALLDSPLHHYARLLQDRPENLDLTHAQLQEFIDAHDPPEARSLLLNDGDD